ncbi:hypothetical protein ACQ4PT_019366 [Festuca glaucescens]
MWSFVVDRGLSVEHIKRVVEENFQWSNDQRMTIWYGSGDDVVPLISESEIAQLFDRCAISRIIRFGVTIENKQQNNGPTPVTIDDENDQPIHAPFFAWPKQAYEGEYEDDEPVRFNEEKKYLLEEKAEPEVVVARVPLGTLDVPKSYDPQHVVGDDETLLANKVAPMHIHDRNNPRIEVGAAFPNSKAFKVALRQLTIRKDWSFITEHSDSKRFNGRCTDKDCPWRIHAYKIKNANTFMVAEMFAQTVLNGVHLHMKSFGIRPLQHQEGPRWVPDGTDNTASTVGRNYAHCWQHDVVGFVAPAVDDCDIGVVVDAQLAPTPDVVTGMELVPAVHHRPWMQY